MSSKARALCMRNALQTRRSSRVVEPRVAMIKVIIKKTEGASCDRCAMALLHEVENTRPFVTAYKQKQICFIR